MSKTTLADIFAAAGATLNDDGSVYLTNLFKEPFDIVLTVLPTGVEMSSGEEPRIVLSVLLRDERAVIGQEVRFISHSAELTLPVNQIRLAQKTRP